MSPGWGFATLRLQVVQFQAAGMTSRPCRVWSLQTCDAIMVQKKSVDGWSGLLTSRELVSE